MKNKGEREDRVREYKGEQRERMVDETEGQDTQKKRTERERKENRKRKQRPREIEQ